MTQAEIQNLLKQIAKYTDQYSGTVKGFLPDSFTIPFIIGKALIDLAPGLEQDISNLLTGVAQTPEQLAATNDKLAILSSPDGL